MEDTDIASEAIARHARHVNHATSRPLSVDYELVGLAGEAEASRFFGVPVDLRPLPGGDGGKDFRVKFLLPNGLVGEFAVDIKTARKAYNLIVEVGKVKVDVIYVLGQYLPCGSVELIGWEWGKVVMSAPSRDFGYGIVNHYIHRDRLRSMTDLKNRLVTLVRGK
jgi:hypothetical protein